MEFLYRTSRWPLRALLHLQCNPGGCWAVGASSGRGYVRADGQRDNSQFDLWQSDLYVEYRPDEHQLWALDFYASRFDGDPGRLTFQQFQRDPNFSPTPYNNNWVDRYTVVLRHEHEFGDGWLLQAKAWFTHQELDSRSAANLSPSGVPPDFTTVQDEGFNNGDLDVRFRKLWGDGTIFKGSALTFGGVVYHGDAPFTRFRNPDLFASRDSTEGVQTLDQDRTSDYQAVFAETLFRLGKFHIVPSFRLDHETVDVNTIIGPGATPGDPFNGHADRRGPVWGTRVGQRLWRSQ